MKKSNLHSTVAVGFMAALVFVSNYIQFVIPTPIGTTRIHIANGICLLAALLLGGLRGGIAAGLGSFLFDLTIPDYAATSWVTLIMKFLLVFICGLVVYGRKKYSDDSKVFVWRRILGTVAGSLFYILLFILRQYIEQYLIFKVSFETVTAITFVTKLPVSLVNAAIAVILSILLHSAIRPALKKSGLADKMKVF